MKVLWSIVQVDGCHFAIRTEVFVLIYWIQQLISGYSRISVCSIYIYTANRKATNFGPNAMHSALKEI